MQKAIPTLSTQISLFGEAELTSLQADSRVSHFLTSASSSEIQTHGIYGPNLNEQYEKFSQFGSFQKTFTDLLRGTMAQYSGRYVKIWNLKVTKSARLYYQLAARVPDTKEIGFGLLPTPLKDDWKGGTDAIRKDTGKQRTDQFRHWWKIETGQSTPDPSFLEEFMGFPIGWTELRP